ncbi:MAG: hypothetical protein R3F14_39930, partial [Polyangiaceae bacterium]
MALQLLELHPLLLELEGMARPDPRRYLDHLLAWASGERSFASAGREFLERRDVINAARCFDALDDPPSANELLLQIERAWAQHLQSARERIQRCREHRAKLSNEGIEWPSVGDLDQALVEAENLLSSMPVGGGETLGRQLARVSPEVLPRLSDALDLADLALAEGEEERRRKHREVLDRLRQA